jgi:hypothetical protein
VLVPEPATEGGLNVMTEFGGAPAAANVTVPLKPYVGVTVTVNAAAVPANRVAEGGVTLTVKSAAPVVNFQWADCGADPPAFFAITYQD